MVTTLPRVVIAAPASGHGKTTVATGLMAALRRAGHRVSGHKVGPDYIDPGYHALATGRPGRNLDPHLVGEDLLVPLLLHGAATPEPADIAVIEGVMGLYDGAIGREGFASTAHVAGVVRAPIILVVDISSASRTIAAVVHGLASFDSAVRIAGVVLNKAGSDRHATEVTNALESTGIPVLGVLKRDDGISAPSRHLGLVPAAERADALTVLDRLAAQIAERIDLAEVLRIARSAPDLSGPAWDPVQALAENGVHCTDPGSGPTVAIAGGRAFTFRYTETDELLAAAGLRPMVFDPVEDVALPAETAGLYLGGGFPEVHAAGLGANQGLRADLRARIDAGLPTVAECAGLLYLCRTVDGSPMVGAVPADAAMTPRLTLSYRTAIATADTVVAVAGSRVTGHEFHRTALIGSGAGSTPGWLLDGRPDGFSQGNLHASYLHVHWAGYPALAARFIAAVRDRAAGPQHLPVRPVQPSAAALVEEAARSATVAVPEVEPDLRHHGDTEIADGLVDLAVNVHLRQPPVWLQTAINAATPALAAYPRPADATAALARRHGRTTAEVLPTSGGAEAFTLIATAIPGKRPVVVHPQFTEPEAAMVAAGRPVRRVQLPASAGFRLDPALVPEDADLVFVGNPTNPTSVLHPASVLRSLVRPGRIVVVDEAFIDTQSGERESLAAEHLPGVLVLRSLTKTWGIAGLRAGYVLAEPALVELLREVQPPWSVSTPALTAMVACSTPAALAEAEAMALALPARRKVLVDGLAELGIPAVGNPAASFVLVDTRPVLPVGADPDHLRTRLREQGYVVRRGDTFPGLDGAWIRIAVRDPATSRSLLSALAAILAGLAAERHRGGEVGSVFPA
ncbi:cobyrinate a,c-diamide synthase [Nakamurella silvestris]|nr:cobyrinate a,c-diamide synthase [Nakamurella silvestris]